MVQAILSQYALNTLIYSLWQKGALSRTFSEEEVSFEKIYVLGAVKT